MELMTLYMFKILICLLNMEYIYNKFSGCHCLDIQSRKANDHQWLVTQRNTEVKIIKGWIAEYKADLIALTKQIKAPAEPKS